MVVVSFKLLNQVSSSVCFWDRGNLDGRVSQERHGDLDEFGKRLKGG